jgi:hypothetical protein
MKIKQLYIFFNPSNLFARWLITLGQNTIQERKQFKVIPTSSLMLSWVSTYACVFLNLLTVDLTTLSVAQTIWLQVVGWTVNTELERTGSYRGPVWLLSQHLPQETVETTENFSQHTRCPSRDWNQVSPPPIQNTSHKYYGLCPLARYAHVWIKQSYPCNRPWRPIGLWDIEAPTFSL